MNLLVKVPVAAAAAGIAVLAAAGCAAGGAASGTAAGTAAPRGSVCTTSRFSARIRASSTGKSTRAGASARCRGISATLSGSASAGAGKVIYEQAGWIHLYEPGAGKSRRLKISAAADLTETRPRYATGAKHVRSADISPSGKRAVLDYRGEIVETDAAPNYFWEPTNVVAFQRCVAARLNPLQWNGPEPKAIAAALRETT